MNNLNQAFHLLLHVWVIQSSRSTSDQGGVCGLKCKPPNFRYSDADVDMNKYTIPNVNLSQVYHDIIYGPGYSRIEQLWPLEDIQMAQEKVLYYFECAKRRKIMDSTEETHNDFGGIVWQLFSKGKIFAKMAQHPIILEVSNRILGNKSMIGSYAANNVHPGMKGQKPHLDYPYYKNLWPDTHSKFQPDVIMSLQFVSLLTEFTKENGGTAINEGSQRDPNYPHNADEFMRRMTQVTGKPGDLVIFPGSIQHCSMPNKAKTSRSGIILTMLPAYILPFEDLSQFKHHVMDEASPDLRRLLGLDHIYPILN